MHVTIPGQLTNLNKYINAERTSRYAAARIKKEETDRCTWAFKGIKPITKPPITIDFKWYVPNKRQDPDNVAFAKKFILDGMVKAGVIPNDGMNWILTLTDFFLFDKENPRVEVIFSSV